MIPLLAKHREPDLKVRRRIEGLDPEVFGKKCQGELDKLMDLMHQTWGVRPVSKLKTRSQLYLTGEYHHNHKWYGGERDIKHVMRKYLDLHRINKRDHHPFDMAWLALFVKDWNRDRPKIPKPWPKCGESLAAFAKLLREGLRLMEHEAIPLRLEESLAVSVDFEIVGFAHDGQTVHITSDNLHRRTPSQVARTFAGEVCSHRNTCKECGNGIPPITSRSYTWGYWHAAQGMVPDDKTGQYVKGTPEQVKEYRARFDLPPDPVEKLLHPVQSRKLVERLQKEGKPTEWTPALMMCAVKKEKPHVLEAEAG